MNLTTLFLIICTITFLTSCTSVKKSTKHNIEQAPNTKCCLVRDSSGRCYEELVPGCSSDSSPLFKEKFFEPDSCCSYWGVDGMCYEELVKGCSYTYQY